jgi:hypothetical protein
MVSIGDVQRESLLEKDRQIKRLDSPTSRQYFENLGWGRKLSTFRETDELTAEVCIPLTILTESNRLMTSQETLYMRGSAWQTPPRKVMEPPEVVADAFKQ